MAPPSVGGLSAPLVHIPLNPEWIPYLTALIGDTMLNEWYWHGTDEENALAVDYAQELIVAMGSSYSRVGIIEMHVLNTLPSNLRVCDGAILEREDYPILYDNIDPVFILDADHLMLPDLRDRFIKFEHTGETLGDTGGSKTKNIGVTNLPPHKHDADTGLPGAQRFIGQANGGGQAAKSQIIPTSTAIDTRATAFPSTANTGDGTPLNIEPQYVIIGHCINLW